MSIKGSIPARVLQGVKQILRFKPSGATTRELAWTLEVSVPAMYRYVNILHQVGLLEPAGFTTNSRGRRRRTRLWRWAG